MFRSFGFCVRSTWFFSIPPPFISLICCLFPVVLCLIFLNLFPPCLRFILLLHLHVLVRYPCPAPWGGRPVGDCFRERSQILIWRFFSFLRSFSLISVRVLSAIFIFSGLPFSPAFVLSCLLSRVNCSERFRCWVCLSCYHSCLRRKPLIVRQSCDL